MQQIGKELRGQRLDPLDPVLRSRILATVREMKPDPVTPTPAPSRRPLLLWGGAAVATALLAVLFLPQSPLGKNTETGSITMPQSAAKSAAEYRSPATESAAAPSAPFLASPDVSAKASARGRVAAQSPTAGSGFSASPPPVSGSVGMAPSVPEQPRSATKQAKEAYGKADKAENHPLVGSAFANDLRGPLFDPTKTRETKKVARADSEPSRIPTSPGAGRTQASEAQDAPGKTPWSAVRGERTKSLPAEISQPILLASAGFDLQGYRFVTQTGRVIMVPFNKSLNALRFARAADGKLALKEDRVSPILYLGPSDTLANAAVPEGRWQPLPPSAPVGPPLFVHPAATWDQFIALSWYPRMTLVGGLTPSETGDASFSWLPGSLVRIGETVYPDRVAYRAYADAHPKALRLRNVYETPPPAAATVPPYSAGAATKKPRP